jgi:hypothetical protein
MLTQKSCKKKILKHVNKKEKFENSKTPTVCRASRTTNKLQTPC